MDTHGDNDMGARRMGVRDDDADAAMVGVPCLVYSRVVGYIRPRSQGKNPMVNPGKYVEMLERLVYEVPDGD